MMNSDPNPYRSPVEVFEAANPMEASEPRDFGWIVSQYPNGIIARRWVATMIDTACLVFLFIAVHAVLGDTWHRRFLPLTLLLFVLYYPLFEGMYGITIGKMAVGIMVVDYQGRPPGLAKAFIRTLLRVIEVNPFLLGGLPAGLVALMSRRKQRLGDMLARTLVIYRADA